MATAMPVNGASAAVISTGAGAETTGVSVTDSTTGSATTGADCTAVRA